jgi:hypothetical protein
VKTFEQSLGIQVFWTVGRWNHNKPFLDYHRNPAAVSTRRAAPAGGTCLLHWVYTRDRHHPETIPTGESITNLHGIVNELNRPAIVAARQHGGVTTGE